MLREVFLGGVEVVRAVLTDAARAAPGLVTVSPVPAAGLISSTLVEGTSDVLIDFAAKRFAFVIGTSVDSGLSSL